MVFYEFQRTLPACRPRRIGMLASQSAVPAASDAAGQQDTLIKEAWHMGSVDILGKPVEPERLMLAIKVGLVLISH